MEKAKFGRVDGQRDGGVGLERTYKMIQGNGREQ